MDYFVRLDSRQEAALQKVADKFIALHGWRRREGAEREVELDALKAKPRGTRYG